MISIKTIPISKGNNGNSNNSSNTTIIQNGNKFEPHYLWGQYFDDTQDINGSMTVNGNITVQNINANNVNSNNVNSNNGNFDTVTSDNINSGNILSDNGTINNLNSNRINSDVAYIGTINSDLGNINEVDAQILDTNHLYALDGHITNLDSTNITTEYLTVTKAAHFFKLIIDEIKASKGMIIVSAANAILDKVELVQNNYWRCYFRSKDPETGRQIYNSFENGDQVICQTFNTATGTSYNVSTKYYWRLVVGNGTGVSTTINGETVDCNYIDLSVSDCDNHSEAPAAGDEIVLLGNRTDTTRQNAIIISAYDISWIDKGDANHAVMHAPMIVQYKGIKTYNLAPYRGTLLSRDFNIIQGNLALNDGTSVEDAINEYTDTYLHIAYSNSSDGSADFVKTTPVSGMIYAYIGFCSNFTQDDTSLTYRDYKWTRILGLTPSDYSIKSSASTIYRDKSNVNTPNSLTISLYKNGEGGIQELTTMPEGMRLSWNLIGQTNTYALVSPNQEMPYTTDWTSGNGVEYKLWKKFGNNFDFANDILLGVITIPVVKDGADGANGQTRYTWIRYADTITYNSSGTVTGGTGMSNDPVVNGVRKKYIGFAYNKTTSTESSNYTDYKWTEFVGSDGTNGIDGADGADGVTYYTWIKYADSLPTQDSDIYDTPTNDTYYIGIAVNQSEQTESSHYTDYTWSLYRGADGVPGTDGNDGVGITSITEYYLATSVGSGVTRSNSTTWGVWTQAVQSITPTLKYLWNYEDTLWTSGNHTYTEPRIIGTYGEKGQDGRDGVDGKDGTSISIKGTVASSSQLPNSGNTKGDAYIIGQDLYVWDGTTWQNCGQFKGADGESNYIHYAWADSADGATNFTTSKAANETYLYIGICTDNNVTDPETPASYEWNLIKGDKGDNGTSITITSTSVRYQVSSSGTTVPTGTWLSSVPTVSAGQYLWTRTIVNYSDGNTTTSYSVSYKAANGTSVTVTGTSVTYATTTTNSQPADSAFTYTTIPALALGAYLWCKEIITFSDGHEIKSYSVSRIGTDGTNGTNGANGSCTHFAYSTSSNGYSNFSTTMFNGAVFIGTYTDTTVEDSTNYQDYTWTRLRGIDGADGAAGRDGKDGTSISIKGTVASTSQLPISGNTKGDAYIIGHDLYVWDGTTWQNCGQFKGDDGENAYLHIAYTEELEDGDWLDFTTTAEDGDTFAWIGTYTDNNPTDSQDPTDYVWTRLRGADGQPRYTWIRYADTITYNSSGTVTGGTGMSNNPIVNGVRKKYIGFAYNKTTSTESSSYTAYKWTEFVGSDGADGIDGADGADGVTYYTWIKYSNVNPTRDSDIYDTPTASTYYIGIAVNKTSPTESSHYTDYTWSLFHGADGVNGSDGRNGDSILSVTNYYLATNYSTGVTRSNGTWGTWTTTVQTPTSTKRYLWNYEATVKRMYNADNTYTDSTTYTDPHIICVYGQQGSSGNNAQQFKLLKYDAYAKILVKKNTQDNVIFNSDGTPQRQLSVRIDYGVLWIDGYDATVCTEQDLDSNELYFQIRWNNTGSWSSVQPDQTGEFIYTLVTDTLTGKDVLNIRLYDANYGVDWDFDTIVVTPDQGATFDVIQGREAAIRATISGYGQAFDALDSRITQNTNRYTTLNATVNGLSSTVSSHTTMFDDVNSYIDSLSDSISVLEQTDSTLQSTISSNYTTLNNKFNNYATTSQLTQTANSVKSEVKSYTDQAIANIDMSDAKVVRIDASSLSEDYAYPVVIDFHCSEDPNWIRCRVYKTLKTEYGSCSYSIHNTHSISLLLDWYTKASAWGTTTINEHWSTSDNTRFIEDYNIGWVSNPSTTKVVGSIGQCRQMSQEIVYVRGGSKYDVATSFKNADITLYSNGYSWTADNNAESYSAPRISISNLVVPVADKMRRSEIVQTADNIQLNVYNELRTKTGIDVSAGTITLDADNTSINGNLKINDPSHGLTVYKTQNQDKLPIIDIQPSNIPELSSIENRDYFDWVRLYGNVAYTDVSGTSYTFYRYRCTFTTTNSTSLSLAQNDIVNFDRITCQSYYGSSLSSGNPSFRIEAYNTSTNTTYVCTYNTGSYPGTGYQYMYGTYINYKYDYSFQWTCPAAGTYEIWVTLRLPYGYISTNNWKGLFSMAFTRGAYGQTFIGNNGLYVRNGAYNNFYVGNDETRIQNGLGGLRIKKQDSTGGVPMPPRIDVGTIWTGSMPDTLKPFWLSLFNYTPVIEIKSDSYSQKTVYTRNSAYTWYVYDVPVTTNGIIWLSSPPVDSNLNAQMAIIRLPITTTTVADSDGNYGVLPNGFTVTIINDLDVDAYVVPYRNSASNTNVHTIRDTNGNYNESFHLNESSQSRYVKFIKIGAYAPYNTCWFATRDT